MRTGSEQFLFCFVLFFQWNIKKIIEPHGKAYILVTWAACLID